MKKNSCTPINPKKYSCYGLKHSYKEYDDKKKNSCDSKIPHSPHNFSNGRPLAEVQTNAGYIHATHA